MKEKKLFKCENCGLHYGDEQLSKDCYDFCTKNKACNVEITVHSEEHKELLKQRKDQQTRWSPTKTVSQTR